MSKPKLLTLPQIPGPRKTLCYMRDDATSGMACCDRTEGHGGMHTWEFTAEIDRLKKLLPPTTEAR